ncbi:MAG: hypothetical protein KC877_01845 [Candidatus Kaiserbacteria bacterium]|nr:hypothetical protein [Candidatus Kaiserbacteria bacterium]MCB9815907.1 hypothetical protein [Candidatus Nomurabacteria bacterium]
MKIASGFLAALVLLMSVPQAQAAAVNEEYVWQLTAISEYVERLLGVHPPLDTAEKRDIIAAGTAWTVASQEENGHFGYEYAPYDGVYLRGEGMVRQAGTLFMLSEVYLQQTEKDPRIATAIEQAIDYFESISLEEGSFWCIKNSERSTKCELGSASLALIGLVNYVTAVPEKEKVYESLIENYFNYLRVAKFVGKGFSANYDAEDSFSAKESPFYNGEAMLALVKYYQYRPDNEVKDMLQETFEHLRKQEHESPLYLWIMAALKEMKVLWPNEAYVTYAKDFTNERLVSAATRHHLTHNYCAPLEGLVSAYSVLEGTADDELLTQLYDEIQYWLSRTTALQVGRTTPYRVNTIDGVLQLQTVTDPAQAYGGFLTGEEVLTQRIDFTQHCVSAYLQTLVDIEGEEL